MELAVDAEFHEQFSSYDVLKDGIHDNQSRRLTERQRETGGSAIFCGLRWRILKEGLTITPFQKKETNIHKFLAGGVCLRKKPILTELSCLVSLVRLR